MSAKNPPETKIYARPIYDSSKGMYQVLARQRETEGTGKRLSGFIHESKLTVVKTDYGAKTQANFGPEDKVRVK